MKKLLIGLLTTCTISVYAQNFQWAKMFGPGDPYTSANAITLDSKKNVYTIGSFESIIDFDPGSGIYNLGNLYSSIGYVSKLDSLGNFVWAKAFGGAGANSISLDASGNAYITGSFSGTVDFDPNSGVYNLKAIGTDAYILKLDASGNFVYAKQFGGAGSDIGSTIKVDVLGNIYCAGSFQNTVDFDLGNFNTNTTALGEYDSFILKLDASGGFVFVKTFSAGTGANKAGITDLEIDSKGNIYSTGEFVGAIDFDPSDSTYYLSSANPYYRDVFVSKLDNQGNFVWAKGYNLISNSYYGTNLALDATGNPHVIGTFSQTVDFDPNGGVSKLTANSYDIFVTKLDVAGNYIWVQKVSNDYTDVGKGIAFDTDGNLYVSGMTSASPPGTGRFNAYGQISVCKLNNSGTIVWVKSISPDDYGTANAIIADDKQNVFVTGQFKNTADFDPGAGIFQLSKASGGASSGGALFVLKLGLKSAQSLTGLPDLTKYRGEPSFSLTSTTTSGLTVSYVSSNTSVATVSGNVVTLIGAGTTTITIKQAGNADYFPAPDLKFTLTVEAKPRIVASGVTTFCQGQKVTLKAPKGLKSYKWLPGNATTDSLVVTSSGTYSLVSGTDTSNTISVLVNAIPTVSLSSFNAVCAGSKSFTLSGGSPNGGIYSGIGVVSSSTFNPSTAGTFPITYTYTSNGCSNSATSNIIVNPLPTVSLESFPSVTVGSSVITLKGGTPTGGTYSGTGVNSGFFTPSTVGVFSIKYSITDINSCSNVASSSISVLALPNTTNNPNNQICDNRVIDDFASPSVYDVITTDTYWNDTTKMANTSKHAAKGIFWFGQDTINGTTTTFTRVGTKLAGRISQPYGSYGVFWVSFGRYYDPTTKTGTSYTLDLSNNAVFSFNISSDSTLGLIAFASLEDINGVSLAFDKAVLNNLPTWYNYQISTKISANSTKLFTFNFKNAASVTYDNAGNPTFDSNSGFDFAHVRSLYITVINSNRNASDNYKPYAITKYPFSIVNFQLGDQTSCISSVITGVSEESTLEQSNDKTLIRIVNILGEEVKPEQAYRGVFIYQYSDGTIKKVFKE